MDFDTSEYLPEFLSEANEHLMAAEELLLEAERATAANQAWGAALVNGLFRALHTIKGMAGMMGFDAYTALAHELEQVLDGVRRGTRRLTSPELAVLIDTLDALTKLHRHLEQHGSESGFDISKALVAITRVASGTLEPEVAEESASPGSWLERLDMHDQTAALVEAAQGAYLLYLTLPIAQRDVAAWYAELARYGKVLGCWDASGQPVAASEAGPVAGDQLQVVFQSEVAPAMLAAGTGLPAADVRRAPLPWEQEPPELPTAAAPAAPATPVEPAAPPPPLAASEAAPEEAPVAGEKASSIRVETSRLDLLMELMGELLIHHTRLARLRMELVDVVETKSDLERERGRLQALVGAYDEAMQSVGRVGDELQACTMKVRMVPVANLFNRFPRIVRDVARECGKQARLEIEGADTELDKNVIEQIGDPLIHLLRNAIDHGLERTADRTAAGKPTEGVVRLSARQQGHHIVIVVSDDGRGIDHERVIAKARQLKLIAEGEVVGEQDALQLIFEPGFSTAERVTSLSGRGVGMDVVQQNIRKLGGSIQVLSEPGRGTRFEIKLPLTVAIARALLVQAAGHTFAVPLAVVDETLRLEPEDVQTVRQREVMQVRGEVVPVHRLHRLFNLGASPDRSLRSPVVLVGEGEHKLGLVVDTLLGQQDVVIKPLGEFLGSIPGIGGATILGDGRVAMILDVPTLLTRHGGPAVASA